MSDIITLDFQPVSPNLELTVTTPADAPLAIVQALTGTAQVSTDAGNDLDLGSDNKLFVSTALPIDPTAYYILARS
jgi:hypothetical protein